MSEQSSLPSDWCMKTVKEVVDPARPVTYGVVQPGDFLAHGVPLIRGQDYSSGRVTSESVLRISESIARSYRRSTLKGGDILFAIVGYVGQSAIVPDEMAGANITQTTARLAIANGYDAGFIFQQLRSDAFEPQIRKYEKGSAQPGLNLADVEKMILAMPPEHEQRRIAEILDTADEAIQKTEVLIAKLKQMKAGLLHDLLTRGIDENGELRPRFSVAPDAYYETRLGVLPRSWDVEVMKDAEIQILDGDRGSHYPGQSDLLEEGHCMFLSAKNVTADGFLFDETQFISQRRDSLLGTGRVERDDVVLTTRGTVGNFAFYDSSVPYDRLRINSGMLILRVEDPDLMPKFFFESQRGLYFDIEHRRLGSGSAQPQLPVRDFESFRFVKPPKDEQREILRRVDAANARIEQEVIVKKKLVQTKAGLMHDLLTGKKRVKQLTPASV